MFAFRRRVSPEPLELALLQHPQELRLRGQAHLGDLVEEQHAARRELHLAGLRLVRAREGAAFVAEQLRLEQLLGQRGAIQCHERPALARGRRMDEPRHDFLAGARLAGHQHGRVRRGDLRRLAQHPAPFDGLADDPQRGRPPSTGRRLAARRVDPLRTGVVDLMGRPCRACRGCAPRPRWYAIRRASGTCVRLNASGRFDQNATRTRGSGAQVDTPRTER